MFEPTLALLLLTRRRLSITDQFSVERRATWVVAKVSRKSGKAVQREWRQGLRPCSAIDEFGHKAAENRGQRDTAVSNDDKEARGARQDIRNTTSIFRHWPVAYTDIAIVDV